MKKTLRSLVLFTLGLSLFVLAGCITISVNKPSDTPAASDIASPTQAAVSEYYYIVSMNGRKGVVNERGQTVLPFEFSDINILYSDKTPAAIFAVPAVVKTGTHQSSYRGMIYGLDGKPLYDGDCNYAYTLSNGLILFSTMENKSGVISYGGEVVVPARYNYVMMCGDSITAVSGDMYDTLDRAVNVDIYDKNGSLLRSGKLNFYNASYDIIAITDDTGMKYGLADMQFQETVPPVWDELNIAGSGLCIVRSGEKYGVIDIRGKEVIPVKYSYIESRYSFDGSYFMFSASSPDGIYLFDKNGKQLFFSNKFTSVYIENGIIIALDKSGLSHYINEDGEDVIPLAGSMYTDTSGLILCYNDQTCSCYTKEGEKLPLPESQYIGIISPDRFLFSAKDSWLNGICSADGSIIVPADYSYLYPFFESNELAVFSASDKSGKSRWGIISVDDGSILLDGFDMLESAGGGLFYAKKGPNSGLIDINGSWIWRTSDYETLMD